MTSNLLEARILQKVRSLESETLQLLQELIRIPSITGSETDAQLFLSRYLTNLGWNVETWNPKRQDLEHHPAFSDDTLPLENRPVVVTRWRGSGGGRSLILNGHIDVVPPGETERWTDGPWSGVFREGFVWGRGSCDMKGGLVSGILALRALQQTGIRLGGDVLMESVIGEETGGVGTLSTVLREYRADAAMILEPTGLKICPVGAGACSFRLHVHGRAAHGAMRLAGVSAVEKFCLLQQAILSLERSRHEYFRHPLFREGQLIAPISIGKISAGDWPSTVPEHLIAEGRYGVLPGESMKDAKNQFESAISTAASSDPWMRDHAPEVEWFEGQFEPADTPVDAEIIRVLSQSHEAIAGSVPQIHGVPYGSDLRFFTNQAKMPAVLYGPGDVALAHSVDERISWQEVLTSASILALTILRWCQ